MFSAGRRMEVLGEFGFWTPDTTKKDQKYLFVAVAPMHASSCLINMTQIYA